MRIILGIIAFTLTFGLSATLVGVLFGFPQPEVKPFVSTSNHSQVYTHKIKSLLKRDDRFGNIRDQQVYRLNEDLGSYDEVYKSEEYRKSINDYYIRSSSMNDSMMPDDLKYAWREHMNAWKKQAEYVNSLKDNGDLDSDTTIRNYADNTKEVNRTWYQVLRIAERYGVETRSFR